jgi:hypothetical protein
MPSRFRDRTPLLIAAVVAALASCVTASAQDCPIPNADISDALEQLPGASRLLVSDRVDPRSEEPIRRYVIDLAGGSEVIVEQQNCLMENLRVTLLSPEAMPGASGLAAMAAALAATPVWRANFASVDPSSLLGDELASDAFQSQSAGHLQFYYPLDDRQSAPTASSEAVLTFMATDSYAAQFGSALTLYIGVGGE